VKQIKTKEEELVSRRPPQKQRKTKINKDK
jgi:hypothetical protein